MAAFRDGEFSYTCSYYLTSLILYLEKCPQHHCVVFFTEYASMSNLFGFKDVMGNSGRIMDFKKPRRY